MTSSLRPPKLVVETREIATVDDLLSYTDPDSPLAWLRRGEGFIGIGTVGGYETGIPGVLPGAAQPFAGALEYDDTKLSRFATDTIIKAHGGRSGAETMDREATLWVTLPVLAEAA